jgi:hypothetical protein
LGQRVRAADEFLAVRADQADADIVPRQASGYRRIRPDKENRKPIGNRFDSFYGRVVGIDPGRLVCGHTVRD